MNLSTLYLTEGFSCDRNEGIEYLEKIRFSSLFIFNHPYYETYLGYLHMIRREGARRESYRSFIINSFAMIINRLDSPSGPGALAP